MFLYACGQSLDRAYEEIMKALDVILKSIKPVNNTKKCKQAYKRRVQRAMYQVGINDLHPTSTPNLQIKLSSQLTNMTVLDVVVCGQPFTTQAKGRDSEVPWLTIMTTHMLGEQATDIVDHMCQEVGKQVKTFEVPRTHPVVHSGAI